MDSVTAGSADRDRHDRQKRIDWMDMDGIMSSRVLVVGAGALGNEVMKDLVLSGFRDITVIDMDDIVLSNLSRCLFFRDSDVRNGMKSEIVAERASQLDPDVRITPIVGKIQDLQDWDFDIIIGCLDNILARMHLNASACGLGIPYVDGATDGMRGSCRWYFREGRVCSAPPTVLMLRLWRGDSRAPGTHPCSSPIRHPTSPPPPSSPPWRSGRP